MAHGSCRVWRLSGAGREPRATFRPENQRDLCCHPRTPRDRLKRNQAMNAVNQESESNGFTLIEILVSLGLCALLAVTVSSAVAFAARAERIAGRGGEAARLVQSLYAAQRLRPDDLLVTPPGWRVEQTTGIVESPDELPREWYRLDVTVAGRELPPFTLCILKEEP